MTKLKTITSGLVLVLSIASLPAQAAAPAKAGAKCTKAGQTQVIGNKKFTCTKSGSKLTWNKGVTVAAKASPSAVASSEPSASPTEATPGASASSSVAPALVKFKNCAEAKVAGATPLTKAKNPELYELNIGLDRDKDGVACEN